MNLRQQTIFDYCEDSEGIPLPAPDDKPMRSKPSKQEAFNDYDGFPGKFKPKKTTDDCYTPPEIYEGVHRVMVAGDLCKMLDKINGRLRKRDTRTLQKRIYPNEVITAALLQKIAKRGICFSVPMDEAHFIRKMDNQSGALFGGGGGGYLLSERAAAERAALSLRELDIIKKSFK